MLGTIGRQRLSIRQCINAESQDHCLRVASPHRQGRYASPYPDLL